MYSAGAIANYLLDKADKCDITISPMKVIKLAYLSHGWYLAYTKDSMVNEYVEAWDWGPVFPSLYHEFKKFKKFPIDDRAREWKGISLVESTIHGVSENPTFPTVPFLDKVWEVYGNWTALELSELTHRVGSPWHTVRFSPTYKGRRDIIDDDLIYEYYRKKLDK